MEDEGKGRIMKKCETDFEFKNWDHSLSCNPQYFCQPRTEAEIVEIVTNAYKRSGVVRAFGARHSWSPLVPTDDTLVNLDKFNRVVSIDKGQLRASVQAGIRIKDLIEILRENGLGLRNLGSIAEQSIAGAISTATHGTGINIGNLSTQIIGMNLITGRGEVRSLSEDRDPELMSAARTSLGTLGLISQVTVQCVQDYNLKYTSRHRPFAEVLSQVEHLVAANERVRLYWHTLIKDDIQVMTMNPTSESPTPNHNTTKGETADIITDGILQPIANSTYDLHQWSRVGLHAAVTKQQEIEARLGWIEEEYVAPYDEALTVDMPPHHQESEYAVPIERAAEAVTVIRKLIEDHKFKDFILVELRFVDQDNIMLSPSYGRKVCYVGGYIFSNAHANDFFRYYEAEMKRLDGKPHWGKHLMLSKAEAGRMYPRWDRFNEIRRDFDPKRVFVNDFVRNLFD